VRSFGPDSLNAAVVINDLGVLAEAEGDLDEAQRDYERVLAIRRRLLGPEHPLVAHALANLSIVRRLSGRLDESLAQVQEALAIMTRTYGPAHPDVAFEIGLLAQVLSDRGDVAGARENYQRALDIWNQIKGPETFDTLMLMVGFATFEEHHGNCRGARKLAEPAIVGLEKVGGTDFPEIGLALDVIGRCELREHAPAAAVAHLERAFKLKDRPETATAERRELWLDLQRARRANGETETREPQRAAR
jgi:tetratricopeptide (TPR) repeat protein